MKPLTTLIEYLSLDESAEQLEIMLSESQDLDLYGNLPLENVDAGQHENLFLGGIYDFLNGVEIKADLAEAVYIGRESSREESSAAASSTAIIELRSPARILNLARAFSLEPAQELLQPYRGQARYLPLNELKGEIASAADPGEYLVLTLPGENLSALLQDTSFLAFLQQYQKSISQCLQGKINETAKKIQQLQDLRKGDSIDLDYLDLTNLPRDFLTFSPLRVLRQNSRVHHLYRAEGYIRQTLEAQFSKAEGKVTLTRIVLDQEERVTQREALIYGNIFYFRDAGQLLMKAYLEGQMEALASAGEN